MTEGPSLAEFVALAGRYTVVPVWRDVLADTDTPIAIFQRIGAGEGSVLLESVDKGERWARFSFIGLDPFTTLTCRGGEVDWTDGPVCPVAEGGFADVLRSVLAHLRAPELPDMPPLFAGMVGAIGFDALRERPPARTGTAPLDAALVFPRSIVVFDHFRQRLRLVSNVLVDPGVPPAEQYADAVARLDALGARLAGTQRVVAVPVPDAVAEVPFDSDLPDDRYRDLVTRARSRILAGELGQVTISRRFRAPAVAEPLAVYRMLRIANPSPYMYLLRLPGVTLVGSSPQGIVSVRDGEVLARAIAGTRPRGDDPDADAKLAAELASDPKELAEHEMLVELALADLASVTEPGAVHITDHQRVVRYMKVMHLVTEVSGQLAEGRTALDALAAVFPAGTVLGTPRAAALRVIDDLEPTARGLYGGSVGYLDFSGNLDMCITIRTLQFAGDTASCQAGAGVVAGSDPELEVRESRAKASALFASLGMAAALGSRLG